MENLLYSVNATMPVFLVMAAGLLFKKLGMFTDDFVNILNKFNYKITLPLLLFLDLVTADLSKNFDPRYVVFVAIITMVMICGIWIGAKLFIKDKSIVGEFVQASYRSSVAVLGIVYVMNIYGSTGHMPMIIIGSVPIYNMMAVAVLTFESGDSANSKENLKKSLINIIKNPIIIAIFVGIICALIRVELPQIIYKPLNSIAGITSPTALLCIGAGFEGRKAIAKIKPTIAVSIIKLVVLPTVFLPIAIKFGIVQSGLVSLIVMLGSPTTPSAYTLAKNMGSEGVLTTSAVMTTTVLSAFTMTFWIFVAKSLGLI